MTVPGIVQAALEDEDIAARVPLGGDDELFVTASATFVYRADGLLSGESVDEFPHTADRLTLSEGRRKTRFSLEYPLEGTNDFTIPAKLTDDVLHPVLAGILSGNGITTAGESVISTYRFSELTLILTSKRLLKHIGEAVWDEDFEEYRFSDVTNLSFEPGNVATQIVIAVDGRPHRIKAPNESADDVCERLKRALCSFHNVGSLEEFNDRRAPAEEEQQATDPAAAFGDGVGPLEMGGLGDDNTESDGEETAATATATASESSADTASEDGQPALEPRSSEAATVDPESTVADEEASGSEVATQRPDPAHQTDPAPSLEDAIADAEATKPDAFAGSGFESASSPSSAPDPELLARLEALEATVARQNELLEAHQQTISQLIAELRQGR